MKFNRLKVSSVALEAARTGATVTSQSHIEHSLSLRSYAMAQPQGTPNKKALTGVAAFQAARQQFKEFSIPELKEFEKMFQVKENSCILVVCFSSALRAHVLVRRENGGSGGK